MLRRMSTGTEGGRGTVGPEHPVAGKVLNRRVVKCSDRVHAGRPVHGSASTHGGGAARQDGEEGASRQESGAGEAGEVARTDIASRVRSSHHVGLASAKAQKAESRKPHGQRGIRSDRCRFGYRHPFLSPNYFLTFSLQPRDGLAQPPSWPSWKRDVVATAGIY